MISINKKIEDFEADMYLGGKIAKFKSKDYLSKWLVVLFYPADFTFICPTELEEAAEHYSEFKKLGAEVISVSTDTVFAHKAWHDNSPAIGKVNFPMLADPAGKLCRYFGTYIEEGGDTGLSLRGTFIIDPDGVLKMADIHDNSIGRSTKEILRRLTATKFVREHKGLVCPASWHPGEETLKPGANLVGKI